jgi:hypothetical protein
MGSRLSPRCRNNQGSNRVRLVKLRLQLRDANVRNGWKTDIAPGHADGQSDAMRETVPVVRSRNSGLRDLVPIYSIGHFAFVAVLVVGIYLMMRRLDPPTAIIVTFGSLLGMAAVGSIGRPSWMLVRLNQVERLERLLEKHRYNQERIGEWVPPLPRWLRWGYNKVVIGREDGAALVTGPATILRGLTVELSRET